MMFLLFLFLNFDTLNLWGRRPRQALLMMAVSHFFHYVPLSIFVYKFIYASNIVWKNILYHIILYISKCVWFMNNVIIQFFVILFYSIMFL